MFGIFILKKENARVARANEIAIPMLTWYWTKSVACENAAI
jgi:hypothetical protein